MHLPSAGMSRFRFNGSAFLHLSPYGHPEVTWNIAPHLPGARGQSGGACAAQCFQPDIECGF